MGRSTLNISAMILSFCLLALLQSVLVACDVPSCATDSACAAQNSDDTAALLQLSSVHQASHASQEFQGGQNSATVNGRSGSWDFPFDEGLGGVLSNVSKDIIDHLVDKSKPVIKQKQAIAKFMYKTHKMDWDSGSSRYDCHIRGEEMCDMSNFEPGRTYRIFPGNQTLCLHREKDFFFQVTMPAHREASELFINFDDGGFCWDQIAYDEGACLKEPHLHGRQGIFETGGRSPFKHSIFVNIPDCSGDFNIGMHRHNFDAPVLGGYHGDQRGFVNVGSVLHWLSKQWLLAGSLEGLTFGAEGSGVVALAFWLPSWMETLRPWMQPETSTTVYPSRPTGRPPSAPYSEYDEFRQSSAEEDYEEASTTQSDSTRFEESDGGSSQDARGGQRPPAHQRKIAVVIDSFLPLKYSERLFRWNVLFEAYGICKPCEGYRQCPLRMLPVNLQRKCQAGDGTLEISDLLDSVLNEYRTSISLSIITSKQNLRQVLFEKYLELSQSVFSGSILKWPFCETALYKEINARLEAWAVMYGRYAPSVYLMNGRGFSYLTSSALFDATVFGCDSTQKTDRTLISWLREMTQPHGFGPFERRLCAGKRVEAQPLWWLASTKWCSLAAQLEIVTNDAAPNLPWLKVPGFSRETATFG